MFSTSPPDTLFLHRSGVETYQKCEFLYWLLYHANRTGIHPARANRYLEMGTAFHKGMELIMSGKEGDECQALWDCVYDHLSSTMQVTLPAEQWTLVKDACLIYGLCKVFLLKFKVRLDNEIVVYLERDMSLSIGPNAIFEARADLVTMTTSDLGEITTTVWNYKTTKYPTTTDRRLDRSYTHDLQGLLETWVLTNHISQEAVRVRQALEHLQGTTIETRMPKLMETLERASNLLHRLHPEAVKYVFAVKGEEEFEKDGLRGEETLTGKVINKSPLVRAYYSFVAGVKQYAWTNVTMKEENKSGYGRLGKGWEACDIHTEEELGRTPKERIDNWIDMLDSEQVPPLEFGSPLELEMIEFPPEKYREDGDIEEAANYVTNLAASIHDRLRAIHTLLPEFKGTREDLYTVASQFPRNRRSCTYPVTCEGYGICHQHKNPVTLYQIGEWKTRVPHHTKEHASLKGGDE